MTQADVYRLYLSLQCVEC